MEKNKTNSREIEYKWQAQSIHDFDLFLDFAHKFGAKISRLKEVHIKDLYLDTPEKFFLNSQLECRLRNKNGQYELTLKSISKPNQKVFDRHEKTINLPKFQSKKAALSYCQNKFFKKINPLFELSNHRRIHNLILPGTIHAEASYDTVLIIRGNRKFHMKEIEFEFKNGDIDNFMKFIDQFSSFPLHHSKSSKFETAIQHFGIKSSSLPKDILNDLTDKIEKINFEKLKKQKNSLYLTNNFEAIHDLRVASRRLRVAFKTFKHFILIKTKNIRSKLKKLAVIVGKKRDFEIFSKFILSSLKSDCLSYPKFIQKMDQAQKKILSVIDSTFYENLIESIEQIKISTKHQKDFLDFARKKIQKALKKVLEIDPNINLKTDDKTLHKIRIATKKLRYICEFFEPLFKKYIFSLEEFIDKTKKIQDTLGDHQDAVMGISMLKSYKDQFSKNEFKLIKKNYELKKKKTRMLFLKIWKDFWIGKNFRRKQPTNGLELILTSFL